MRDSTPVLYPIFWGLRLFATAGGGAGKIIQLVKAGCAYKRT